jgi:hypothetical protein
LPPPKLPYSAPQPLLSSWDMNRELPLRSLGSLARHARRSAIELAFAHRLAGSGSVLVCCAAWGRGAASLAGDGGSVSDPGRLGEASLPFNPLRAMPAERLQFISQLPQSCPPISPDAGVGAPTTGIQRLLGAGTPPSRESPPPQNLHAPIRPRQPGLGLPPGFSRSSLEA